MAQPSPSEWLAYAALSKQFAPWGVIKAHLERELADTLEALSTMEDEAKLRRLQGRAQAVREFLANVEKSSDVVDRKRG